MTQVIGIDLGGSAIKLGVFSADGTCHQSLTIPTPQPATPEAVVNTIALAISQLNPNPPVGQINAIGIGTPGPADADGRIARVAINLANWKDVPLADWL
ncbi:MAG: ROK family protein, partial [Microcoleaceae cyanobacterium]